MELHRNQKYLYIKKKRFRTIDYTTIEEQVNKNNTKVLIAVRESSTLFDKGVTAPYTLLGYADYALYSKSWTNVTEQGS